MKRLKRHKIKTEKAESSLQHRELEEHDLAYYIHDRVELMHQVFSMLKYKELKAMAPECVRNLAIGDLEELCTEELLGISSKRLLAVLDGAEPPSDTESSSPSPTPDLETISLDSISSDEELLASSSKKKKHKHHHRRSKSKSKKKNKVKEAEALIEQTSELSKASRAGLTVLELLELQARARAIRAQLQQEQVNRHPSETTAAELSHHSSDNEVEIKEEPADVVEISSEDEKPDVNQLQQNIVAVETASSLKVTGTDTAKEPVIQQDSQTITKRINDLVITVPHVVPTRKIKLNRNKVNVSVPNKTGSAPNEQRTISIVARDVQENVSNITKAQPEKTNENKSKKRKKDKKKKSVEKDGSDHDEITLQLSDTEKMDLLEDLDESRKNYDKVSSSSEDTESSSSDSDSESTSNQTPQSKVITDVIPGKDNEEKDQNNSIEPTPLLFEMSTENVTKKDNLQSLNEIFNNPSEKSCTENEIQNSTDSCENLNQNTEENINSEGKRHEDADCFSNQFKDHPEKYNDHTKDTEINKTDKNKVNEISAAETDHVCKSLQVVTGVDQTYVTVLDETSNKQSPNIKDLSISESDFNKEKVIEMSSIEDIPQVSNDQANKATDEFQKTSTKDEVAEKNDKCLSDGELSDRQSSDVETIDVQPVIVCISDEDGPKNKQNKKKKKKEKKSKKEKKLKKSKSDFHEAADQNFYRDANIVLDNKNTESGAISLSNKNTQIENSIDLDIDDVYEIMELSDDSSCYEVEGTILSKEPTTEEIEALSAKIDEIDRVEVITDDQIREHEQMLSEKINDEQNDENIDTSISWKDRYLGSKKVKKVLTTANILNALRKKNKELKKKIQDSKKIEDKEIPTEETTTKPIDSTTKPIDSTTKPIDSITKPIDSQLLEEGSIEQYNTLQGSTKYVDPVKEPIEDIKESENDKDPEKLVAKASEGTNVTREMKKDAKQLLKMYKRLLKHNDMHKQKDPNKKKKKKQKKKEKQDNENNKQINNS